MITPSSLPAGVKVELSRAPLHAGSHPVVDEWMSMLNDRLDECVDTLHRERMALELAFRHTDADEWLYAPDHIRHSMVAWATEGRIVT